MSLFESILMLVFAAIVLLQVSRRLSTPYPAMLAMAGVAVAALPWAPEIEIEPRLALALFIAPVLLDAAFDLPPRELWRYSMPLVALAGIAVLLTTAAVAWSADLLTGMPVAAAVALGAIVAPPDAAAATATLSRFSLPRRMVTVLKGESLLNDAVALLIFNAAMTAASSSAGLAELGPQLALQAPGGLLFGIVVGKVYLRFSPLLAGTEGGTLMQFVMAFGIWVLADRLHLSAILAVVAFAMIVARYAPERVPARDRVHSYSVWAAVVFLLNVLAFLLLGLQARTIIARLDPAQLWQALGFAVVILAVVVIVRLVWVLAYNRLANLISTARGGPPQPGVKQALVVSWCGMRGLVTLAIALALPADFPARDLIVLSALAVVLGTLVLQGLTLGPLIRWLALKPDDSFDREISSARMALMDAAAASLSAENSENANYIHAQYAAKRQVALDKNTPTRASTDLDRLRLRAIAAERRELARMRREGKIDDDIFHALEQELDWDELSASPPERYEILEG
jgi:Na+/H+ antiporter